MHVLDTESANCTLDYYYNDTGIEMAKLSFEGLDGVSCNLSVSTTETVAQCLENIKIVNKSKPIKLHV